MTPVRWFSHRLAKNWQPLLMMNRSKCGVAVYLNEEKGNEKLNIYGQSVFPYTPATNLLYGLKEALILLRRKDWIRCLRHRHWRKQHGKRFRVGTWKWTPSIPTNSAIPWSRWGCRRSRCRSIQKGRARKFQCFTGQRPWGKSMGRFSYRTPRRLQCPDAPRNPRSDWNGARNRGNSLQSRKLCVRRWMSF